MSAQPITDLMELEITRNVLKYAVGRQMFCPCCKYILDCRRALLLDGGETRDGIYVICAKCWDGIAEAQREQLRKRCEVTDGRDLWKAQPRAPREKKPRAPKKIIEVGDVWETKVGDRVQQVRIDRDRGTWNKRDRWQCTNLRTGRVITRSTRALRRKVSP